MWRPWRLKAQSQRRQAGTRPQEVSDGAPSPLLEMCREVQQYPTQDRMPLVRPGVLGMDGEILQFWEARKLLKEKRVFTLRDVFVRVRMVL